jgi:hypothetical protein
VHDWKHPEMKTRRQRKAELQRGYYRRKADQEAQE